MLQELNKVTVCQILSVHTCTVCTHFLPYKTNLEPTRKRKRSVQELSVQQSNSTECHEHMKLLLVVKGGHVFTHNYVHMRRQEEKRSSTLFSPYYFTGRTIRPHQICCTLNKKVHVYYLLISFTEHCSILLIDHLSHSNHLDRKV